MWNPRIIDTDKSLYIAIADAMERDVRNGTLKPGERMPTHRELAEIIGVNVTTITRAYANAEKRGLITGTVGRGTFITADVGIYASMAQPGERNVQAIEMGLVLPLYIKEPDISKTIENLLKTRQLNRYMRYSDPLGLPEHRETGALWVKRFGIEIPKENILICSGAQHALTCILSSFFKSGDKIAAEYLIYPGMKAIAKTLGIKLEPVAMDAEGMLPESLERVCQRSPVKGVYLMPNMQNPTTSVMSLQRKRELSDVILRHGLIMIEDDIYSFSNQKNQQAITPLVPENSVYIAGISKAFYAGLRVAFVAAPKQLLYKIGQAVVNTIWMTPALNVAIACECIRDGSADMIIADKLREAEMRYEKACRILSGYAIQGIPGGFFVWLKLPEEWSGKEFEIAARESGVNVFCADKFAVGGEKAPSAVRISLSGAETMEELVKGLNILKNILLGGYKGYKDRMELETIF
jgi:DNA-binding transcriptional MocR family regulator